MQMRTSKPQAGNKFYITKARGGYSLCIQGSPTDKACDVLANCVGYACGRFNEIIGSMKYPTLNCNAENFIERAKSVGLQISNKPTLGGIMVWQCGSLSGSDGAGHVGIVERIDNANQVYTSESSWGGTAFFNAVRRNDNGRWGMGSGYSFRGCIINPAVVDPTPTPTPATFAVGDKVVPKTYVDYYGTPLMKTRDYYFISQISGDRAVLNADSVNGGVYCAMNTNNLTKYNGSSAPVSGGFKYGDSVIVNGVGTADSYGGGAKTRNYVNQKAKVMGDERNGRYPLNCNNDLNGVTGWFAKGNIRRA